MSPGNDLRDGGQRQYDSPGKNGGYEYPPGTESKQEDYDNTRQAKAEDTTISP